MRFLLINTNPAVSKLVGASISKMGYELVEIGDYNSLALDTYILIVVDSESYRAEYMDDLLSLSFSPSLLYLKTQDSTAPQEIKYILEKPFLPTDFMSLTISILKNNPELKRFITPQIEELSISALQNVTQPQEEEQVIQNQQSYENDEQKTPIFDIKESPETELFDKTDIFSDLSKEFSSLYSEVNNTGNTSSTSENETYQFAEPIEELEKNIEIPDTKSEDNDINSNDFLFDFKEINEDIAKNQEQDEANVFNPQPEEMLERPTYESSETQEKINIDFDIFDKIQKQEIASAENTPKEKSEEKEKINFIFEEDDLSIEQNQNEENVNTNADFGFGELAKEFNDLIQSKKEDEGNIPQQDIIQNQSASINEQLDKTTFKNALNDLSEKEVKEALQNSGMLPRPSELEVVKSEIEHMVQQSVKGVLQSQILRDVLKGLKMNITITFEDK